MKIRMISMMLLGFLTICIMPIANANAKGFGGSFKGGTPSLTVEADKTYIYGFPFVLKITAKGPQSVPLLNLFSGRGSVKVTLTDVKEKDTFTFLGQVAEGGSIGGGPGGVFPILLNASKYLWSNNDQRTMLLDVSTLKMANKEGVSLSNPIPAGDYSLVVEFQQGKVKSAPVDVTVKSPAPPEEKFLAQVAARLKLQDDAKKALVVDWSRILEEAIPLDNLQVQTLSEDARNQLSFHLLLSSILASAESLQKLNLDRLKSVSVPAYLNPEQAILMLEIRILSGEEELMKQQMSDFSKQNPGLSWRLQDIQEGGKDLLRYKKASNPVPQLTH